jgi:phosphomevalonate kinase
MGEYAVLEEGGLGIGIAPEIRATATCERLALPGTTVVEGSLPGSSVSWPGDAGLLGRVCDYLDGNHGLTGPFRFTVDTSAFFDNQGRKRGYGSSAAMTVVLAALWLAHSRADGPPSAAGGRNLEREHLFRVAVRAHRAGQSGSGSGYDVAASTFGGLTLFTGGEEPTARAIELPWLPPVYLFAGPDAVITRGAVGRLREWQSSHAREWGAFLAESNRLVLQFAGAGGWADALAVLREYRELTQRLGEGIGVTAEIAVPAGLPGEAFTKAIGAGNELGIALVHEAGSISPEFVPVTVAAEGARW